MLEEEKPFMMESNDDDTIYAPRYEGYKRRSFGSQPSIDVACTRQRFESDLLVWALDCVITEEGWTKVWTEGLRASSAVYLDVDTGTESMKSYLSEGVTLLQRQRNGLDDIGLLLITVKADPYEVARVTATAEASMKPIAEDFIAKIETVIRDRNFYRGKQIEMGYRISFLKNMPKTTWADVNLPQETKDTIQQNTIGFLRRIGTLKGYRIPARRGVMLIGDPGTGKSSCLRALLNEASGITCIVAIPALLRLDWYILSLFSLAAATDPAVIIVEDIDQLIADRRYGRESSLFTLLNEMDGLETNEGVIVVCTANSADCLDRAASRPSRIDITITLQKPTALERIAFIHQRSKDIPLDAGTADYIVRKTEGFTLCQVQAVLFSLVIAHVWSNPGEKPSTLTFTNHQIDTAISQASRDSRQPKIGFNVTCNGTQYDASVHSGKEIRMDTEGGEPDVYR